MSKSSSNYAVVISDLHIHNFKLRDTNGSRLDYCIKALEHTFELADKYGIKFIFHAGDLYHKQQNIPTVVVNRVVECFKAMFEKYKVTFITISGNHDHASTNTGTNEAVSAVEHLSKIFDQFLLIDNLSLSLNSSIMVHGVPYYRDAEFFSNKLNDILEVRATMPNKKHYLLIHQNSKGMLPDFVSYESDPEDERYKLFDFVFCGHIHKHKRLADNYYSVGNPIHQDASDAGETKGALILNLDHPERGCKFFRYSDFPKFIKVHESDLVAAKEIFIRDIDYPVIIPSKRNTRLLDTDTNAYNTNHSPEELLINFCLEEGVKEYLEIGKMLISS